MRRCCGTDVEMFLDLGESPIADAYTATADEVSKTFPLRVGVCLTCHLVQLLDDVDPHFDDRYSFYSSASAPLRAYHEAYARRVLADFPGLVARGVVEVGCNDGDLLRHFPLAIGVDPAAGPASVARERGLEVLVRPFGLAAAHEIRERRGLQGVVIANHVLAHAADLGDVLAGIASLLANDGVAVVEVQYLPDLLVSNAFDLVYHEHRRFFSLTTLLAAAARHGLFVLDVQLTDRQGGSLRATLALTGGAMAQTSAVSEILRSEQWLASPAAYAGMQGRAERIRTRLLDLLDAQEGITAVYGAPAKATTLLNFCGLTADDLPWAVDTTPAKQGRFIPGTGIPIVGPDHMGASQYLLASWNYLSHVMRANPSRHWILPLPAPVVI